MIASSNVDIEDQLDVSGVTAALGPESIYRGDERVGASVNAAEADAVRWIEGQLRGDDGRPG